ncbi:MAG: hypothetical protein JJU32_12925 [Phormidium sp. BM_Day4_Bin.17]|nr:hypothetical protein [Phormidium sp. BM_Day4_Bin.17]UCJ11830.1 MAG: hypothetical protein JWS08_19190 [Phormidium sp. PBR-2020]
MSYTFDIINILPVLNFFDHQQKVEQTPHRSLAYLGSYDCTLDGFNEAHPTCLGRGGGVGANLGLY